jgi:hypothetical protein
LVEKQTLSFSKSFPQKRSIEMRIAGLASVAILAVSTSAFAAQPSTTPPGYDNNPGRAQAQSHVGKCDGYDGTATTTGAGAGGFGFQTGQGNNQAGGNQGTPNYNPLICGNPNDNALVRGPN